MENKTKTKANGLALIPFLVFIVVYLGFGIFYQMTGVEMAFYQFPSVAAIFVAVVVAFLMFKGSVNDKFAVFARGVGNIDVLTMLTIYLLAGAFASVAAAMGAKDSTVNLGISLIPLKFLAPGLFLISAFLGTATGTSMGTISALAPIAVGIATKANLPVATVLGAVVGGAMFGDNLSMISDTTIAATRSQNCEMRDKFRVNLFIALPAAIITMIILFFMVNSNNATADLGNLDYNIIKVVPYVLVLVLALIGINVFTCLTLGIVVSGVIGIITGGFGEGLTLSGQLSVIATNIFGGFNGMTEVFFLTFFCAGMSELVIKNGGIEWIITKLRGVMKDNKSAQVGIGAMVSLVDCATANNTVAIVISGKVANDITKEFKVDPRKTASLLDIFSCVFQGIIPYGAQLLTAASLAVASGATIAPVDIMANLWYCWILGIIAIIDMFIPFADGICRKDPWNWEYDCAESMVAEKKKQLAA